MNNMEVGVGILVLLFAIAPAVVCILIGHWKGRLAFGVILGLISLAIGFAFAAGGIIIGTIGIIVISLFPSNKKQ